MSGSDAEERIRGKVEASLREVWPDARIVHELMLQQGGCRIDLAAITPTRLIVAEIKSERDVLTRLKKQVEEAKLVADGVAVVTAASHLKNAMVELGYHGWVWAEGETRFGGHFEHRLHEAMTNAPARLNMLWASELRRVAETSSRSARSYSIRLAADNFTGAEIRKRVCAALRARPFPRADPPILSELFPEPSVGSFS